MSKRNMMCRIDAQKLSDAIRQRGLDNKTLSLDIGRSSDYITTALRTGTIGNTVPKMLQLMYHIEPEIYVIKETNTTVDNDGCQDPANVEQIDYDRLEKIITRAVSQGVKEYLEPIKQILMGAGGYL